MLIIAAIFILNKNKFVQKNYIEEKELEEKKEVEEPDEYTKARKDMVEHQLKSRDIADGKVLEVMNKVQRHKFVPHNLIDQAYSDHPLPIGHKQTISQPYIIALMTQSLEVDKNDKILEIGTGSGYQAAVLAGLVKEIYTIEIIESLATSAENRLNNLGYENVKVKNADGYFGWPKQAPFDAIIVTAAANHIPPLLLQQLKDGGKLHMIWMAPEKDEAEKHFDDFIEIYEAKYPKAAECLKKDRDALLTFYDFPAEHWRHIRTTNPIESTFSTVRLRTAKVRSCFSSTTVVTMAFKLCQSAQKRWQRLHRSERLAAVIEGVKFINGIEENRNAA